MRAIVTVKLPRNPEHDPRNKQVGPCPVTGKLCTDITGNHHSYLAIGESVEEITATAVNLHGHVTRVEVLE